MCPCTAMCPCGTPLVALGTHQTTSKYPLGDNGSTQHLLFWLHQPWWPHKPAMLLGPCAPSGQAQPYCPVAHYWWHWAHAQPHGALPTTLSGGPSSSHFCCTKHCGHTQASHAACPLQNPSARHSHVLWPWCELLLAVSKPRGTWGPPFIGIGTKPHLPCCRQCSWWPQEPGAGGHSRGRALHWGVVSSVGLAPPVAGQHWG